MGKLRAKKRRARGRLQPTGLPSVKETVEQQQLQPATANKIAILDQLSDPSPEEREWACRSLSHLIENEKSLKKLLGDQLVRKSSCLLVDPAVSVRIAAAGMLRNLSLVIDDKQCRYVVSRDVMTPLSAMIRDCLAKLDQIRTKKQHQSDVHRPAEPTEGDSPPADDREKEEKDEREGAMCISENAEQWKSKIDAEEAELCCEALEQGLHLLWNITERSDLVVKVFNKGSLSTILTILQPSLYPDQLLVLAAQVLQTITEDNVPIVQEICSSREYLSQLESLLQDTPVDDPVAKSLRLLMRTCIAGVFQNLLPGLPSSVQSQTFRGVISFLSHVLDIDVPLLVSSTNPAQGTLETTDSSTESAICTATEIATSRDTVTTIDAAICTDASPYGATVSGESEPTSSKAEVSVNPRDQVKSIETTLSAVQVALETLANISYIEAEYSGVRWEEVSDDDDDADDDGDGGEGKEVADMETDATAVQHKVADDGRSECDADLLAISELGIHEKVWKLSCLDMTSCQRECDPNLHNRLSMVHSRSLVALQNLLTVLPLDRWGSGRGLSTMWTALYANCGHCADVFALTGVLQVIAEKMTENEVNCVTLDHVQLLSQVGLTYNDRSTKVTVMSILGRLGKLTLDRQEEGGADILQMIGSTLRDCILHDPSVWVICQALDSIYDIFGDDRCPPSLCVSLSLLPALRQLATVIKEKFRVERKFLKTIKDQRALVQNSRASLPRFIDYMTTRCQT